MDDHRSLVEGVCRQVREAARSPSRAKIVKGSVGHFVPDPREKRSGRRIDLSGLDRVLEIDARAMTCTAEGGTTFERLVAATLPLGLAPMCVPELRGITVGGAVSGCSVESMSFRHGGFHDSCIEYEVVTGRGDVVACTPEGDPELFHMLHGSYGTLGIITKAKFRLVPAKPFVRLRYSSYPSARAFREALLEMCERSGADFVDGIAHSKDKYVICAGEWSDGAPRISSYGLRSPYYKSTARLSSDHMRAEDYFFRYDADCHWLSRTVPPLEWPPIRLTIGRAFLGSTNLIRWSKRLAPVMRLKRRPDVVVDVFIPASRFDAFVDWYEREFDYFPLWVVPYRPPSMYPWISEEYARGIGDRLFIDFAIYGKRNSAPDVDLSEILERKVVELNGIKTLISRNHFDERTFWRIYNRTLYDKVKSSVDPRGLFPNLYEKFKPES